VVDGRRCSGLLKEPYAVIIRAELIGRQELQRNNTIKFGVVGLEYQAHPAPPDLFNDLIMGNRLSNHLSHYNPPLRTFASPPPIGHIWAWRGRASPNFSRILSRLAGSRKAG
jgi:hypothetical protein